MKRITAAAMLLGAAIPVGAASAIVPPEKIEPNSTYCNPLNLDYCFRPDRGIGREAADPVIVPFKGDYYLFPSKSAGYWWSSDLIHWNLVPIGLHYTKHFQDLTMGLYRSTTTLSQQDNCLILKHVFSEKYDTGIAVNDFYWFNSFRQMLTPAGGAERLWTAVTRHRFGERRTCPPQCGASLDCGDMSPLWVEADLSAAERSVLGLSNVRAQAPNLPSPRLLNWKAVTCHRTPRAAFLPSPRLLNCKAVTCHRTPRAAFNPRLSNESEELIPHTMHKLTFIPIVAAIGIASASAASPVAPLITADYQKLVSAADVDFTGSLPKAYHGMPIGTGEMGSLVWNSGSSALKFQINRTDVFGCNNAVTAVNGDVPNDEDVTKVVSDFGYGCGYVTVDFGGTPFGPVTKHHLSLYDGKLAIAGEGVSAEIIAGVDADAFIMRIKDSRSAPQDIRVDLTLLQKAGVTKRPPSISPDGLKVLAQQNETVESLLAKGAIKQHYSTLANGSEGTQLWLTQKFEQEAATEFREMDHYSASSVVIDVSGRNATAAQANPETVSLTLKAGVGEVLVHIASAATLDKKISVAQVLAKAKERAKTAKAKGYDKMFASNQAWWRDFWGKSYVCLPADEVSRSIQNKWYYYLYLMASSTRGQYPARFGGNIWNINGNNFGWGTMSWGFNEEPMQHSYEGANHGELQDATLRLNLKNYESYKTLARQQWIGKETDAIFIEETRPWNGPEKVPDSISKDLLACTTPDGAGPMTPALTLFAILRHYHDSRWQLPSGWTGLTTINGAEKAEHYWDRYLYTLDLKFLKDSYKMIKGAAEFYRNTPHLKLDADGFYHHYKSNIHEHIYGAKDAVDDIAFIRGSLTAAIKASQLLNVDAPLRPEWQNIIDKLTPYVLSSDPEAVGKLDDTPGKPTWAQACRPVINGPGDGVWGAESPRLRMLENFDILTLETVAQAKETLKTQPADKKALKVLADWNIANHTFEKHPGYLLNLKGLDWKGKPSKDTYGYQGGKYVLDAATLARPEYPAIMASLDHDINQVLGAVANRFHQECYYDMLQGFGMLSAGLQKGLLQSIAADAGGEPVIHVFPAWDMAKPAAFRLLAKGGFLVSASARNGAVSYVEIVSQLGGSCRIRNPWPESKASLFRNGVEATDYSVTAQSLLTIKTQKGETLTLVKRGTKPENLRETIGR